MMGTGVIHHLEKEDCATALPTSTLLAMQEHDSTVSRVVQKESRSVLKLLKHGNKLTLRDGMLYKVKRYQNMNKKLYQFNCTRWP